VIFLSLALKRHIHDSEVIDEKQSRLYRKTHGGSVDMASPQKPFLAPSAPNKNIKGRCLNDGTPSWEPLIVFEVQLSIA
jgi:hypothetical protein